jgi:hypothetical protein
VTRRDRILLGVVAVVAVLAGFHLTVLKPGNERLAELDEQIAAAEQRRDTALADLRAASAARKQYERDQATLAVLGKAVPADDGVPSLLYQLHKAARTAGVTFDAVTVGTGGQGGASGQSATPGTMPGPNGLNVLPLRITFDGDFFALDRFLRAVDRLARITDERVDVRGRLLTIDAVSLTPDDDGLPTVQAEIAASAYVAPATGGAGSATGQAGGATAAAAGAEGDGAAGGSDATGASDGAPQTGVAQ